MTEGPDPPRHTWFYRVGLFLFLASLIALSWRPVIGFLSDPVSARQTILSFGGWGPVILVLVQAAQVVWAPVPGSALALASGYVYGPVFGPVLSVAGVVLGSFIAFVLARRFGQPFLKLLVGRRLAARLLLFSGGRSRLFYAVLFAFPNPLGDGANYLAGLSEYPVWQLTLLSFVGRSPGMVVACLIGASMLRFTPLHWGLFFGVIALLLLAYWLTRRQIERAFFRLLEKGGR